MYQFLWMLAVSQKVVAGSFRVFSVLPSPDTPQCYTVSRHLEQNCSEDLTGSTIPTDSSQRLGRAASQTHAHPQNFGICIRNKCNGKGQKQTSELPETQQDIVFIIKIYYAA